VFRVKRGQAGFTLVEMTLTVVILGVFMATAILALTTAFAVNVQTSEGLSEAGATELTIVQFSDDIRDAGSVTVPSSPGVPTCQAGTSVPDQLILEVSGSTFGAVNPSPGSVSYVVDYVTRTVPATANAPASTVLYRVSCSPSARTVTADVGLNTLASVNMVKAQCLTETSPAFWTDGTDCAGAQTYKLTVAPSPATASAPVGDAKWAELVSKGQAYELTGTRRSTS